MDKHDRNDNDTRIENIDNAIEWTHGDPSPDPMDKIDENVTDSNSIERRRWYERKNKKEKTPKEKFYDNMTAAIAVIMGFAVAVVKFVAAFLTGSSAMFSEGIHSTVDSLNDSMLLIGTKASKKPPDTLHQFGHGRLLYFYTFVVSLVIFFFGGGVAIYDGVTSLISMHTVPSNLLVNCLVLIIGMILEGISLSIALKDVNAARGEKSIRKYITDSKNPVNFTVLLEDTAAVSGMLIALLGIILSSATGVPFFDSTASIIIGMIMCVVAIILLKETRSLLVGEGLSVDEINDIVFIVEDDPCVLKCGRVLSMYMSPDDVLLTLDVTFDDEIDEGDVLKAIDRIEERIITDYPQCTSIFIEVESLNQVYRQRYDRETAFSSIE